MKIGYYFSKVMTEALSWPEGREKLDHPGIIHRLQENKAR
jgi:hypothetical protein